jgi:uncharacterized DUF497 family protein
LGQRRPHVTRHEVNPTEVEETVERPHAIIPAEDVAGEKRWKLFGTLVAGRYLVIVFTIRAERLARYGSYHESTREKNLCPGNQQNRMNPGPNPRRPTGTPALKGAGKRNANSSVH